MQNTQETQNTQNTHTKRPTNGDALPQRGACRERECMFQRREREKDTFSAPWNLHLSKYSFYGKVSLSVMSNKTVFK
jgi:hypothetical protein